MSELYEQSSMFDSRNCNLNVSQNRNNLGS